MTYLDEHVHKYVNAASVAADSGFLTDHGPDHIRKLIQRMGALVGSGEGSLSPYEVYILFVAAQFHDVGNIYGRAGHEEQALKVMQEAGKLLGIDSVEKRCIYNIARAHGGVDKDKIGKLPRLEHLRGLPVRVQMLAAILKFGDELAEDSERAARFLLDQGRLPEASRLYHAYAECLNSVFVDGTAREVYMRFDLRRALALQTFLKPTSADSNARAYLMDEIFLRTMKTHYERAYCSRFMRPFVELDSIRVTIEVTDDSGFNVLTNFSYRLEDVGYPDASKDIYAMCPELQNVASIGRLGGSPLAQHLGR